MPIRLWAKGGSVRIENMNLIQNKSDAVKPTSKVIKQQDVSVSKVEPPTEAQDSMQQEKHQATEHVIDFLEKRKKHQQEKKKFIYERFQKIIIGLNTQTEQQRGSVLNIKG